LPRPDVDDGVVLDALRHRQVRADVDPPKVFLAGSGLEEKGFLVGLELSVDGHPLSFHADDGFDQVSEQAFGHAPDVF
jgi:hypothetical protein